jgi:hypothetical protein
VSRLFFKESECAAEGETYKPDSRVPAATKALTCCRRGFEK